MFSENLGYKHLIYKYTPMLANLAAWRPFQHELNTPFAYNSD